VWECQSRAKYLSKEKLTQRVKGNVTRRAHVWHGTLSLGTLGCLSAPTFGSTTNICQVVLRCVWNTCDCGPVGGLGWVGGWV
jgi:hypothetical protein